MLYSPPPVMGWFGALLYKNDRLQETSSEHTLHSHKGCMNGVCSVTCVCHVKPLFSETKWDSEFHPLESKKLDLTTCLMTPSIGNWALFEIQLCREDAFYPPIRRILWKTDSLFLFSFGGGKIDKEKMLTLGPSVMSGSNKLEIKLSRWGNISHNGTQPLQPHGSWQLMRRNVNCMHLPVWVHFWIDFH